MNGINLLPEKQAPDPMLEMEDVTFAYRNQALIYNKFSLTLAPGKVYGLLGMNTIGKTTLMKLMTTLLFPQEGTIRFRAVDISHRDPSVMSEIFLVPDEVELPSYTQMGFVNLYAPLYPRFDREVLEEWTKRFQVDVTKRLDKLSMGERKKFYLSFAVATRCSFLLLDEPTNGLDILAKDEFKRLIALYMSEDHTVLISTHQGHEIERILDHLLVLDSGGLVLNASLVEIAEKLCFESGNSYVDAEEILFSSEALEGVTILRPRGEGDPETGIDLEFLFRAIVQNPVGIRKVMQ